jgi:hypothetical protein
LLREKESERIHVKTVLRHLRENKIAMVIVKSSGEAVIGDAVGF